MMEVTKLYIPYFKKHNFKNMMTKDIYVSMRELIDHNPDNTHALCEVISYLQHYIFSANVHVFEDEYTYEQIYISKQKAALEAAKLSKKLIAMQYVARLGYITTAQNYLMGKDFKNALFYYERLLEIERDLDKDFDYGRCARIVHNICQVYLLMGENEKAQKIRNKNDYFFQEEKNRNRRIIRDHPELTNRVEADYISLNTCSSLSSIYYDTTLNGYYHMDSDILSAILEDASRNKEEKNIDICEKLFIRDNNGNIELFEDDSIFGLEMITVFENTTENLTTESVTINTHKTNEKKYRGIWKFFRS